MNPWRGLMRRLSDGYGDDIFDVLHHRYCRKGEKKAMRNKTYAYATKRLTEGRPGSMYWIGPDEELNRLSKLRQKIWDDTNPHRWHHHLKWWLDDHGPTALRHRFRWFVQRGKRGFADYDAWNFNSYLARVIADYCDWQIKNGHTYPGYDEADTPEKWKELLARIRDGFRAYVNGDYEDPRYPEAMMLFVRWYESLWD